MAIGKSKISDLSFDSFQNMVDKNIETERTSDKFDRQLRAYTEAGERFDAARKCIDTAKDSLDEAYSTLQKAISNANVAARGIKESFSKFKMLPSVPKSQHRIGINFLNTETVLFLTRGNSLKLTNGKPKKSSHIISMT